MSTLAGDINEIMSTIFGVPIGENPIDTLLFTLKSLGDWVSENKENIIGWVQAFTGSLQWIIDNQDTIATWLHRILILFIALQVIDIVTKFVLGLALGFISFLASAAAVVGIILLVVNGLATFAGSIATAIGVIAGIVLAIAGLYLILNGLKVIFAGVGTFLAQRFTDWYLMVQKSTKDITEAFTKKDWGALGRAIIEGAISGVVYSTWGLVQAVANAAGAAYNQAKKTLGIRSPSTLFAGIGENMMLGMTKGIDDTVSSVTKAMKGAVMTMTLPAMQAPAMAANYASPMRSNSYTSYSTQNNNLTINTSASSEPIIQDFNMLRSLAG
jgi:hypothetical protein